jgi:hypothetical protein
MAKRLTPQEKAQRALVALDELLRGSLSKADQDRVFIATRGLRALDDEQARVKRQIEGLLEKYDTARGALTDGLREQAKQQIVELLEKYDRARDALVDGLRELVREGESQ